MDRIITQSRGYDYVEIDPPLVLEDTARTRTVFKAAMHSGGIRGDIIRFRKGPSGETEELVPVNFNSLHEDEGIKITLNTEAVESLYNKLQELGKLLEEHGIQYGAHNYTITDADALVINDQNKARVLQKILDANLGEDMWNQLVQNSPDIATRLAYSKIQEDRLSALNSFDEMLRDETLAEEDWQRFFEHNTWIFGYGLRYQILNVVQAQPNYGGTTVTGIGGQRGDFLTATEAIKRFICLVEIKKPGTSLLQRHEYRNGAWGVSNELSGAVSQVQVNCAQWEIHGARQEQTREYLGNINTISPKGIVVVGKTSELDTWEKKNSFERFRREIHNPEIITYDELFYRARYIVEAQEQEDADDEGEVEYEDLPF